MSADAGPDDSNITNLRLELKKWEASFAAANGGRKAGREDIRNDATIGLGDANPEIMSMS